MHFKLRTQNSGSNFVTEATCNFRVFYPELLLKKSINVEQNFLRIFWRFRLRHLYTFRLSTFNNTKLANMRTSEVQMKLAHSKYLEFSVHKQVYSGGTVSDVCFGEACLEPRPSQLLSWRFSFFSPVTKGQCL